MNIGTHNEDLTSPTKAAPVFTIAIASLILLYMHITNIIVAANKAQKKQPVYYNYYVVIVDV